MVGGSTSAIPTAATPTISAPLAGGHFTQQTIQGAFQASNPPQATQRSYAEATQPALKGKNPMGPQPQSLPPSQPTQPSRKRAVPQSDPKPTQPNNTQFQFNSPPHDDEEEPEDTPFFIQLAQLELADDKKDIKSEDIATLMKFLLSKLEGTDATPDGMDKGRKGPWIFYVDDDTHDPFKAAYGDKIQAAFSGGSLTRFRGHLRVASRLGPTEVRPVTGLPDIQIIGIFVY